MPELALDDRQRHPFAGHLDRMRMPELMRREPPPHPRHLCEATELGTGAGG